MDEVEVISYFEIALEESFLEFGIVWDRVGVRQWSAGRGGGELRYSRERGSNLEYGSSRRRSAWS